MMEALLWRCCLRLDPLPKHGLPRALLERRPCDAPAVREWLRNGVRTAPERRSIGCRTAFDRLPSGDRTLRARAVRPSGAFERQAPGARPTAHAHEHALASCTCDKYACTRSAHPRHELGDCTPPHTLVFVRRPPQPPAIPHPWEPTPERLWRTQPAAKPPGAARPPARSAQTESKTKT